MGLDSTGTRSAFKSLAGKTRNVRNIRKAPGGISVSKGTRIADITAGGKTRQVVIRRNKAYIAGPSGTLLGNISGNKLTISASL
jgi:hypothetical protein